MNPEEFEEVVWRQVYDALHDVPRIFQLWAYKQVMDVAGTNYNLAKQNKEEHDPCRPSCGQGIETYAATYCTVMNLVGLMQCSDPSDC